MENFSLPTPDKSAIIGDQPHTIQEEMFDVVEQEQKTKQNLETLNCQQTLAYQMILKAITDSNEPKRLFFIDAPGAMVRHF